MTARDILATALRDHPEAEYLTATLTPAVEDYVAGERLLAVIRWDSDHRTWATRLIRHRRDRYLLAAECAYKRAGSTPWERVSDSEFDRSAAAVLRARGYLAKAEALTALLRALGVEE